MNFIEAVRLLKANKQNFIKRKSNEKDTVFIDDDSGRLKTNSWLLLTEDILATDWEVYEKQTNLYSFEEAVASLRKGKSIRRKAWINRFSVDADDDNYYFTIDDLNANDWVIKEETK